MAKNEKEFRNSRREFIKTIGMTSVGGGLATLLTGCPGPEPSPTTSCYPNYAPNPNVTPELELGQGGSIFFSRSNSRQRTSP